MRNQRLRRIFCTSYIALIIASLIAATQQQTHSREPAMVDAVERVYVIRRKLGGGDEPPINRGVAAHSGLLLMTKGGEFFVLEYMNDSKVHLIRTRQQVVQEHVEDGYAHIVATGWSDDGEQSFHWTRQLKGKELPGDWSPEKLKAEMEKLVSDYSVWSAEHCHAAQERLRKHLNIF